MANKSASKALKINWEALREKVKATDKAVLKAVVNSVDGWTIFAPKHFLDNGLDAEIVKAFTKEIESDFSSPKGTIFDANNRPVQSVTGVYGLSLLEFIASTFGVDSWKSGRGFRANHLAEQLTALFDA